MHLTNQSIKEADRIFRLNLINSITGIKPGNLIGSISENGDENLAIFSSVVHLGSSPPLLGFIVRPEGDVRRHTLENLLSKKVYTINQIGESFIDKAHYTSVKFEAHESEFEQCQLTPEYVEGFEAPFVKESALKMGLEFREILPLMNGTQMVVGEIVHLIVDDKAVAKNGYLDLSEINSIGISGLNTYYRLEKISSFPYARKEELPEFNKG